MQLDVCPMGLWMPGKAPNNLYSQYLEMTAYPRGRQNPTRLRVGMAVLTRYYDRTFLVTGMRHVNTTRSPQ